MYNNNAFSCSQQLLSDNIVLIWFIKYSIWSFVGLEIWIFYIHFPLRRIDMTVLMLFSLDIWKVGDCLEFVFLFKWDHLWAIVLFVKLNCRCIDDILPLLFIQRFRAYKTHGPLIQLLKQLIKIPSVHICEIESEKLLQVIWMSHRKLLPGYCFFQEELINSTW